MDQILTKFTLSSRYSGLEDNMWHTLRNLNPLQDKVNLGSGNPDFMPNQILATSMAKTSFDSPENHLHQYTRGFGHPRLVKALGEFYGKLLNRKFDSSNEILISSGAYGALFTAMMSLVGEGDEVIIIEPFFDCYAPFVQIAGGKSVFVPLRPSKQNPHDSNCWTLDEEELESCFNSNTKAIIINSPNNPLGKVFNLEELQMIANLCVKYNVLVFSDEVYEWIVFGKNEHIRMASLEGMWERTITIGSAGKTFSLTGWRLGWAYGPNYLLKSLFVCQKQFLRAIQTPGQEAVAEVFEKEYELLGTDQSFFEILRKDLETRRDLLAKALNEASFPTIFPHGGYFLVANWTSSFAGKGIEVEGESRDFGFVRWLAQNKNLITVPPSAFYSPEHKHLIEDYVRFTFYKKEETLIAAINNLSN